MKWDSADGTMFWSGGPRCGGLGTGGDKDVVRHGYRGVSEKWEGSHR